MISVLSEDFDSVNSIDLLDSCRIKHARCLPCLCHYPKYLGIDLKKIINKEALELQDGT